MSATGYLKMEDFKDIVTSNLKLMPDYCVTTQIDNIVECLFNDKWIRSIIETKKFVFPAPNEMLSQKETLSLLQLDLPVGDNWQRYLVQILNKKDLEIFSLPRKPCSEQMHCMKDLTIPELLHYVSVTNMKNLWNDSYTRFSNHTVVQQWRGGARLHLEPYNKVLKDALQRLYRCPIVSLSNGDVTENNGDTAPLLKETAYSNVHPAVCVLEGIEHFFVVMEPSRFSVFHCLNFSPSRLQQCETSSLFMLFQILEAVQEIHDLGLFLGNISLHNLRLDPDFHLTVIPSIYESFQKPDQLLSINDIDTMEQSIQCTEEFSVGHDNVTAYLQLISNKEVKDLIIKSGSSATNRNMALKEISQMSLLQLTQLWVTHEINNFDYLLSLSYFAGHSFDSPLHYPTLPWVTDFTSPNDSWRDLTKTKYRLNKGDQQLNHTYELPYTDGHQEQIAHHVPEFFSEVTYYVYKARVTPKQILQKHVRQQFVPSHYPASIARMYSLTPEECIPEFYCDPTIFKSIHEDLPDLEVPSWCSGVHDFIQFHRQSLESNYVSRRLHHWIDLYYGYKLSGNASVKAKNVCLPLVDGHTNLMRGGVVQLFNVAHPPKLSPSPFLSKIPPPPCRGDMDQLRDGWIGSPPQSMKSFSVMSQTSISKDGQLRQNNSNFIELPQNYNPLSSLTQLEILNNFSLKLSHSLPEMDKVKESGLITAKQVAQLARMKDMKVIACLIVQIFCPLSCRTLNPKSSFEKRYEQALKVFQEPNDIPHSLHYFLNVIFDVKKENSSTGSVTYRGLPPPTCYQLLHPQFGVISLPAYFEPLNSLIRCIKSYFKSLNALTYKPSKEHNKNVKYLTESYMSKISVELKCILPQLSSDGQKLILPHITDLFRNPASAVSAAWYLTDTVLQFLDRSEIKKSILPLLIKLFESEVVSKEHCLIFQQVYLLQLMVRLGMKIFLAHFITPIIEAVGEYKICIDEHKQHPLLSKLSPNLKDVDSSLTTCETLEHNSPEDEESGLRSNTNSLENFEPRTSSIHSPSGVETDITDVEIDTEMFVFEGDELEDDTTVEDFEGALVNVNSQSRTSLVSDTESLDDCSIQEEIIERNSIPSVCASPVSPSFSGDVEIVNNESTTEYLKGENSQVMNPGTLGIPLPSWRLPEISSDIEFSRSLPENEKHHHLTIFQNFPEGDLTTPPNVGNERAEIKSDVELTLSDICCENVLWLSQKLGPVLTARHLTRNLLRMLTLCYAPESGALDVLQMVPEHMRGNMSVTGKSIVGDRSAAKVIFCLLEIAELYGEQVILVQYLSHITELVGWCGSKFSSSQEGGLIGAMSLLQHLLLRLSDTTFMDHLQETLIRNAVYPVIRLLSSLKVFFPNGSAVRSTLAWKVIDSLYIMARRVGIEMSKEKLSPAIKRFLTAFCKTQVDKRQNIVSGSPITSEDFQPSDFGDISPVQDQKDRNLEEMKLVFTPEMAYLSYIPFCKFLGTKHMEDLLQCHELLRSLCLQYDECNQSDHAAELTFGSLSSVECVSDSDTSSKFQQIFGTDVAAVTGNRIDIKDLETPHEQPSNKSFSMESSLTLLKNARTVDSKRHLKGNWLAYWEHEIGRNDQNKGLNLKQIKLQSFIGHSGSVKGIYVLDNENSAMSCSRDKTVKLWSLRSQGDGSAEGRAQYTYTGHKKSVINITFCEPLRLAASCDSTVHIWDPFVGTCLKQLDSLKHSPVTVLCSMNGPSTQLIAATTDYTLKLIDMRTCSYAQEMKISSSSVGLVRCLSTSQDSHLVGVAHSSGVIATLDLRTGQLLATWKPHEGEILTLQWHEKGTFLSSALDQTLSVWSVYDKKLKFSLKGPTEPVHLLRLFEGEIITGTTANRIGIHTSVSHMGSFSSTRLRSETFRGVLSAMEVLPLNRQLLLGADNGSLQLLC